MIPSEGGHADAQSRNRDIHTYKKKRLCELKKFLELGG